MFDEILLKFGLRTDGYAIEAFGSGLINDTYKLTIADRSYILQQVNTAVFKNPHSIISNLGLIEKYLSKHYPSYLFVAPLKSTSGEFIVQSSSGEYFRLFPFIPGSHAIDTLESKKEAFEAARQFGRFTFLLNDFNTGLLEYPLVAFHDLPLRHDQFETAYANANTYRKDKAATEINEVHKHHEITDIYSHLLDSNELPLRVIHHDTKISNVLFNDDQNALCVVDLDTVMPGYYLSDVGDMMRTYLSPANEEEKDLSKVYVRYDFFEAIYKGYLSEMGSVLTEIEKQHFIFAGKLIIYMQALRFLTDYLNNDTYYGAKYPGHNLTRAKNQFKLLNEYINAEPVFKQIINNIEQQPADTIDHKHN